MASEPPRSKIYFYGRNLPYFDFSNFSQHPIVIDGEQWPTNEHYFQSRKFNCAKYADTIKWAPSAKIAAMLGRSRAQPIREDWEDVKENFMMIGLQAKFTQHEVLKTLLLGTRDAIIIERSDKDAYWGDGAARTGKNRLGELLMKLREQLREQPGEQEEQLCGQEEQPNEQDEQPDICTPFPGEEKNDVPS